MQLISKIMTKGVFRYIIVLLACCLLQSARAQCILETLSQDLLNSGTSQAFKDFIKGNDQGMMAYKLFLKNGQVRKDVDVLEATSKFLTNHSADYMRNYPGKFENIMKNLTSKEVNVRCNTCTSGRNIGIPTLDGIIDDMDWALTSFKNTNVNINSVFTEMATQGGLNVYKADGGAFMLNVIRKNAALDADYVKSIERFEYRFLGDDGNFEADIYRTVDDEMHLSEFKSLGESRWYAFSTDDQSVNQFMAYFTKKEKFEYFANASKLGGRDKAYELVRKQFLKLFKDKSSELFRINPSFFKNITFQGKQLEIIEYGDLVEYLNNADFYKSSLFDFVNVIAVE